MPEQPAADATPDHADTAFEPSDAQMEPIVAMGVGIILLGVIAHFVCLWLFGAFKTSAQHNDPELPALAAKERPKLLKDFDSIPAPRLQVFEAQDMDQFREKDEAWLNSYGWTDPKTGKVHIPIKQAMQLLTDPEIARARGIRTEPAKGKEAP